MDGEGAPFAIGALFIALAMADAAPAEAAELRVAIFVVDTRGGRACPGIRASPATAFAAGTVFIREAALDAAAVAHESHATVFRELALARRAFAILIAEFARFALLIAIAPGLAALVDASITFAITVAMGPAAARAAGLPARLRRPLNADLVVFTIGVAFADRGAATSYEVLLAELSLPAVGIRLTVGEREDIGAGAQPAEKERAKQRGELPRVLHEIPPG